MLQVVLEPFQLPYAQRGLVEILFLAVPAGVLGTWIVLRGLAFFSHAVGTATFPGLVLADGLGFAAPIGAFAAAAAFTAGNAVLGKGRRSGADGVVAIVLVACIATGVILASDVFASGSNVETLLFGSLLLVDDGDIALAAACGAVTLLATALVGRRWLARGFDPMLAGGGREGPLLDALLLGLIALATTAALTVVGALLVAAVFVLPALTARLLTARLRTWQLASVALVAIEGTAGLWLSVRTNAPPGATIACASGATFLLVAWVRAAGGRPRPAAAAVAALVIVAALGAAFWGQGGAAAAARLRVVATTTQIADWARHVAGPGVSVEQILKPNTDPHDYEPRPGDVEAVAEADLVLSNGDGLDDWVGHLLAEGGGGARPVVVGASVPERIAAAGSRPDPHWFNDPRAAEAAVGSIERALAAADPAHRRRYARDAGAYLDRLRRLDRGIARCMRAVPAARRKLVTDHDAFAYFARRYRIDVVGAVIPSQATEAQTSAGEVARLLDLIREEHVAAVFPERSLSPKIVRAVADQSGAGAGRVLYGDSLGPAGSAGATYIGMQRANADAMVRGFTDGRRECPIGRH